MKPEISILISAYNVENFIIKCLDSIFNNTYISKSEILIIEDCSKDNTRNIIEEYICKLPENLSNQVKFIKNDINKGIAINRQTLLELSNGKYFIYADSDDWVEPDYIEQLYKKAIETDADIVTCGYYKDYTNRSPFKETQPLTASKTENCKNLLINKIKGYLPCKLIKKSLISDNNIKFLTGINMWEDFYFSFKAFYYANNFASVDSNLYHYRTNENSLVNTNRFNNNFSKLKILREIKSFLINKNNFETFKKEFMLALLRIKLGIIFETNINRYYLNHNFSKDELKLLNNNLNKIWVNSSKNKLLFLYFYSRKQYLFASILFYLWKIKTHPELEKVDFKKLDYSLFDI